MSSETILPEIRDYLKKLTESYSEVKTLLKQLNDKIWYLILVLVGAVVGQKLIG